MELITATDTTTREGETDISCDDVEALQFNHNLVFEAEPLDDRFSTALGFGAGQQYVIFLSDDRGGSCLSAALGKYGDHLGLLQRASDLGPDAPRELRLGNRFLAMPTSLT